MTDNALLGSITELRETCVLEVHVRSLANVGLGALPKGVMDETVLFATMGR